ncbi:MAG TPA: phosphoribosylaminoimidazolesuccinocarboxamide synthase [Gemmatimonadales bacterium]|nr:phosphoribosylaminoimidazolesuccinocarboxamide synthase [Gemmatimonadales bacterium]
MKRSTATLVQSRLPLPLLRRGKVREVYEVDAEHLLLVASDRVSAFDVVMRETVPLKGAVLTQISAYWFERLADVFPSHYITARTAEIIQRVPGLAGLERELAGRTMLVRRAPPVPFECVVRGYLSGSAWAEYRLHGTLAGERLPAGLRESERLEPPLFSPATKAESGHDLNVTFTQMVNVVGAELAGRLRDASFAIYEAGRDHAARRGIIIADTKFEFGLDPAGTLRVIDELLTPDSSRFWPADLYAPGGPQPSLDKQPLRDYLASLKAAGQWTGEAPPPALPLEVIDATSRRYLDVYRLLTGRELSEDQ